MLSLYPGSSLSELSPVFLSQIEEFALLSCAHLGFLLVVLLFPKDWQAFLLSWLYYLTLINPLPIDLWFRTLSQSAEMFCYIEQDYFHGCSFLFYFI